MTKWLTLSALVIVIDQITKYMADHNLVYASPAEVMPFLNYTLLYNRGAAFSFLNDASGWQRWFFITIASGAVIFIFFWLRKLKPGPGQTTLAIGLSLVLGGAAGNLIDRILYGHVIDFIQLYYQDFYWPAFNIADSAIFMGAVLLIWNGIFQNTDKA